MGVYCSDPGRRSGGSPRILEVKWGEVAGFGPYSVGRAYRNSFREFLTTWKYLANQIQGVRRRVVKDGFTDARWVPGKIVLS